MLINGKRPDEVHSDVLVLRPGPKQIVITAMAVPNFDEFDKLMPEPSPPTITKPGGVTQIDASDSAYRTAMMEYAGQRTNWIVVQSLKATENLVWETVDEKNPETWKNWRKELQEAKFAEIEQVRILTLVTQVNSMDDQMLAKARSEFLAGALQDDV